jgi:hypothetical protein
MYGIAVLLSLAAVGVDYGWQPGPDGQLEYIVQIEPALFEDMRSGRREVASEIHPDARGVRRFRIRVGTDPLPRLGTVAPGTAPARRLDAVGDQALADPTAATRAAGDVFPYAAPSPGILNLPPPPAMIGPDGKASVLVRPGDNALPGAGVPSSSGWERGVGATGSGLSPPVNPADTSGGYPVPQRDAWDASGPRVAPPGGFNNSGASGILPPTSNPAPAGGGFDLNGMQPMLPVPGSQPETGLPSPIRSSGMNEQPKAKKSGVGSLLAGIQTKRPRSSGSRDVLSGEGTGAAAQKPTLDEETAKKLQEFQAQRPWVPLVLTSLALFGSLAANAYLGWVAAGIYRRYRDMCEQLHEAQASLT